MNIDGTPFRTIWLADDGESVEIITQRRLPHALEIIRLRSCDDAARAIKSMQVRGAPSIGATAAYGPCLASRDNASDAALTSAYQMLLATRPTAVNLRWALDEMRRVLGPLAVQDRAAAYGRAAVICDEDSASRGPSSAMSGSPTFRHAGIDVLVAVSRPDNQRP